MDSYFIDSTVWIDFFKGGNDASKNLVIQLIEKDLVFYNGTILCELLLGARSENEYNFLQSNFKGFHFLETTEATYAQTARIGYDLRRKGLTLPLSYLIITAHCLSDNLTLLTRDNHFQMIKQQMPLLVEDLQ